VGLTTTYTRTLSAGEIAALTATDNSISFADATTSYASIKETYNGLSSDWSNTVTVTIDAGSLPMLWLMMEAA
jgi:hypothetical protein